MALPLRPFLILAIDLDQIYAAAKFQAQRELRRITADVSEGITKEECSLSPTLAYIILAATLSNCFIELLKLLYVVREQ